MLLGRNMSFSRKIPSRGIAIKSTNLKPSKLPGVSFASLRTLLGKLPPLLCALLATGAAAQVSALRATGSNHLNGSKSSYLQRASQQPIDWYPWGEEAFRKAKELDRPILLDLGAEWCPYCVQMDRESYERPEMAKFINDHFVSIKVDYDTTTKISSGWCEKQIRSSIPSAFLTLSSIAAERQRSSTGRRCSMK